MKQRAKEVYLTEKKKGRSYYRRAIRLIAEELNISEFEAAILVAEIKSEENKKKIK